jgi:excisionase family DNA binding protein
MAEPQVLSVREAAEILGVSVQRVRQMLHAGQFVARRSSAGWLISANSVKARSKGLHRGRPAEPRTAWAAINLLASAAEQSLVDPPDGPLAAAKVVADRRLRHRVLQLLAAMPDPGADEEPWLRLLSSRGQVRRFWVHPGLLDRLADDPKVSLGGASAVPTYVEGLTKGPDRVEIYVGAAEVEALIRRYRMRESPDGQVKLVIVPLSVSSEHLPAPDNPVSVPAAAAGMLEEDESRVHHAAVGCLQLCHRALHDIGWLDKASAARDHNRENTRGAISQRLLPTSANTGDVLSGDRGPSPLENQRATSAGAAGAETTHRTSGSVSW